MSEHNSTREERPAAALRELVYEETHLSPEEKDGSHRCRITKASLANARTALKVRQHA